MDAHLDELMELLDRVPLAVAVIAKVSLSGDTSLELIARWKKERSRLLDHGEDRLNSVEQSILISVTSTPMKKNSEALKLLQILAMLPGGAKKSKLSALAPSLQNPSAALATLIRASLAYLTSDRTIRLLSPIRCYILERHPLGDMPRHHLHTVYYAFAQRSRCDFGPELMQLKLEMVDEEANMNAVLLDALQRGDAQAAIRACEKYSWFLLSHILRTDIIVEAIKRAEELDQLDLVADCLYIKAKININRGQHTSAALDLERARAIYNTLKDHKGVAQCLQQLGDNLRLQSRYEESNALLVEAKSKFDNINNTFGSAQCLRSMGDILYMQGRYEEAHSLLTMAKSKFDGIGDTVGSARCLRNLGNLLYMKNRYEEAHTILLEAKSKFDFIGDTLGAARCLRSIGEILYMQGQDEEARTLLDQAKSTFDTVGDALASAQCLKSLGNILYMQRQYGEARSLLDEAKSKFDLIGNTLGAAQCLQSTGDILLTQNLHEEAITLLTSAKSKFDTIGNNLGSAQCLQSMGSSLYRRSRYEEAHALLTEARAKFDVIGNTLGSTQCRKSLVNVLLMQSRYEEAQRILWEGKNDARPLGV